MISLFLVITAVNSYARPHLSPEIESQVELYISTGESYSRIISILRQNGFREDVEWAQKRGYSDEEIIKTLAPKAWAGGIHLRDAAIIKNQRREYSEGIAGLIAILVAIFLGWRLFLIMIRQLGRAVRDK